jgi:osmotically-inducible protein OsmY
MAAALGCNDDTTTLVHAQARVNEVMTSAALNTDSEVQVSVNDGVATLTGKAPNDAVRARAVAAARSADGVRDVIDHITTPATLTGAVVPRK